MPGKILPSKTMIMRIAVGTAVGEHGIEYDMSTSIVDSSPIVQSKKTGKYWSLSWQEILNMAIEAGINEPEPKEETEQ